jgi:hypothetical protein
MRFEIQGEISDGIGRKEYEIKIEDHGSASVEPTGPT